MKLRIILLLTLISLFSTELFAKNLEAKRGAVSGSYNFWFYQPDSAKAEAPKPIVIFLHGASLCGNDLNKVRRYGTIDAIDRGRQIDAYVVAPQNPGGAWSPSKVMKIVDWVMDNHNADSTRVYVLGMSLGGYGAIDVAAAYPDRIAAAMSFCGGGTSKNIANLNKVPLWIVHGTADRAVSVNESDKVVSTMRAADHSTPRLIYDRVPGMNHSQPARFFYLSSAYDWLMSHSLDDPGRPVNEKFDLTGSAHSAYAGLSRGSGHNTKAIKKSSKSKHKSMAKSRSKSKKKSRSAQAKARR